MRFLIPWLLLWAGAIVLPVILEGKWRELAKWLLPMIALAVLGLQFSSTSPIQKLTASSLCLLFVMKGAVLLTYSKSEIRRISMGAYTALMTVWPGMDIRGFASRRPDMDQASLPKRFNRGLVNMLVAATGLLLLASYLPALSPKAATWFGLVGLLLLVHFGVSELMTVSFRLCGYRVSPLFENPLQSQSINEFWTQRWNRPFADMNRRLFLKPLINRLGRHGGVAAVFLISGVLHELAISYPAGAGWGGPFIYFMIQAGMALLEESYRFKGRLLTWLIVLGPFPLLFHEPFRLAFIYPLLALLHALVISHSAIWYLGILLWAVGCAQVLVLAASFQVPTRLHWREELSRLSPFNRKLMWSYGFFIVFTILTFAALTFGLHNSFLRGEPAALALAGFMCLFWVVRLIVDFFYYSAEDWPKGVTLQMGHSLLNLLFVFLAAGYGGVVVAHFVGVM
jgi:alginate O-acetyltransferase complex protein AlgI